MEVNNKYNADDPSEDRYEYLIEYRGDFLGDLKKVDYAYGYIINEKFAIVSVLGDRIDELAKEIPSILFVSFRSIFVLESTSVRDVSNIRPIKINPYLNLTGSGVLIGIADTGIDYLNKEFIREDNTSRIEAIWDQTIAPGPLDKENFFTGTVYSNADINRAINVQSQGGNPLDIVPSQDNIGHGTNMASIAGARGYDEDVQGVANDCNFVIVKLRESELLKKQVLENNIQYTSVYNTSVIVAGLEYLKRYAISVRKPIIILLSIGTSDHSHDGSDVFSRYVNELASLRGLVFVAGVGNEGAAQGHASGFINREGDTITKELNVPRNMKLLPFRIWVRRPNIMSLSVVSPSAKTLPEGTVFLESDPNQTINAAGGARKAISVGYYNQENNSIMAESGRGFPLGGSIKPDIAAPGVNILATSNNRIKVSVTGSTASASIVAGTCALLVQWGIIKGNDPTMYSSKIISYLTSGARRKKNFTYPDRSLGYGLLDLERVFNNIAGILPADRSVGDFIEYNINNLFIRIPVEMVVK